MSSKMDALRAMREARYERSLTGQTLRGDEPARTPRRPAAAAKAAPEPAREASVADDTTGDTDARCGHRNMSGRTCTREQGHAAKSHRYS